MSLLARATGNDSVGDEFLLRSLWRERREQEQQFMALLGSAQQEDGWRLIHQFDYTPEFRRWLLNRRPDGWELLETNCPMDDYVRIAMRRALLEGGR